jgi:hypothetical protein
MNLHNFLSALSVILNSEIFRILTADLLNLWRTSRFKGAYKVKILDVSLELMDRGGKKAIYRKREVVQYIQDGVFAVQDQAWGNGSIFVDYRCFPGRLVDKYQEGYRWYLLISLRGLRKKGDTEEFTVQRTIENGFTTSNETFQVQVDHPMDRVMINVIFPRTRIPRSVTLVENNLKRSHSLQNQHVMRLPDGRICYSWKHDHPRLYEGYILKWEW